MTRTPLQSIRFRRCPAIPGCGAHTSLDWDEAHQLYALENGWVSIVVPLVRETWLPPTEIESVCPRTDEQQSDRASAGRREAAQGKRR